MKRAGLSALLREHGFAGGASTFRKLVGKTTVFVVNVQRSTSGGSYINLGVHLKHLGKSHWPDVEEHQCAFRTRLQDFAGGERFFFDDESSVLALCEMWKLEGVRWFERFEPEQLATTVKQVAKHGDAAPDTWARVAKKLGDAASEKRLIARGKKLERERKTAREAELAATVMMTMAEYRAAKKAGTLKRGISIQIVG